MTLQPYFRPCVATETPYLVHTVTFVFVKVGDVGFRARNFLRQLREPLFLSLGRRFDGLGALRRIDDAGLHAAPSSNNKGKNPMPTLHGRISTRRTIGTQQRATHTSDRVPLRL